MAQAPIQAKPEAAARPKPETPPKNAAPVPEARQPIEGKPTGEVALDNARRKANGVGLLAIKSELAELSGAPAAVQLKQGISPGPDVGVGVGVGAGVGVGTGVEPGAPVRAMITSNVTNGSGGINTAAYSRDIGGGGGSGGGGGGAGPGGGGARDGTGTGSSVGGGGNGGGSGKGGTLNRGNSGKATRSIEDIKLVFERNKGAIYALDNRAA